MTSMLKTQWFFEVMLSIMSILMAFTPLRTILQWMLYRELSLIYMSCVILIIISNYFFKQHKQFGLCIGDVCRLPVGKEYSHVM
jgi:hypothetical protein